MNDTPTLAATRAAVDAFNAGDPAAIRSRLGRLYFASVPGDDEPGAAEVIGGLLDDLRGGLPDLKITLHDVREAGDVVHARATLRGTHTGELWGVPGSGRPVEWTVDLRVRPVDGGFAFNLDNVSVPAVLAVLRELELVSPADKMHLPPPHPNAAPPEFILRLVFNGQVADRPCTHLDRVRITRTTAATCSSCEPGAIWPALRMCLTCGHVGCCDTSLLKHAKLHYEQTGHPLMRSIHRDEAWMWCYEDGILLGRRTLDRLAAELGA